ncbi:MULTISPECIES: NADP-dependent oxidoreductase [Rhodopseudomonas]|uniref:NADP-dependent oxidoreductase n=1 Tax=Rhodopseudomonas TaxID=1073 RepID=UPI001F27542E|nr:MULTISPECIES: NADP-dependent oxidoreductase [Rhodopseudomonas]MDF3811888.1 NADP-dependent oxidoreductase [Rhodopseudomonas sp. BAL398]WOK16653.1 NADP-dependent oxidoreductase [Rhodopseudomonas sp. BAL398]
MNAATNPEINRQILLVEKPTGKLGPEHFKMADAPIPEPKDGEALLRVRYISLDAANRAWMHGATYRAAVETNTVMAGGGIAEVVASKAPGLKPGDIVFGDTGWQDFAAVPAKHLSKMPNIEPMTHLLSVYGIAGLTAYFGLLDVGKPKAGETVVVSAAAGSVGSIVGQIAKIKGCRVVGIAGGKDKCDWLTRELGFDAAVDYKDGAVFKALRAAAPNGIDVYFDNVGGDILEACLAQMNLRGRIACCGAISQYDGVPSATGPRGVPGLIVVKRLIMQGFIVMDYMDQRDQALTELQSWVGSGKLKVQEDVIDGLENTPQALIGLLAGENRGKRMVKL